VVVDYRIFDRRGRVARHSGRIFHAFKDGRRGVRVEEPRPLLCYAGLMFAQRRNLVSEAEFLSLPESLDGIELLDGGIIVTPSSSYWHQEILQRVVYALRTWAHGQSSDVPIGQASLDVRFGDGRILQPDAFMICAKISPDYEGPITEVPALCVEVLSTHRAFDRLTKRLFMPPRESNNTGSSSQPGWWNVGQVTDWRGSKKFGTP